MKFVMVIVSTSREFYCGFLDLQLVALALFTADEVINREKGRYSSLHTRRELLVFKKNAGTVDYMHSSSYRYCKYSLHNFK